MNFNPSFENSRTGEIMSAELARIAKWRETHPGEEGEMSVEARTITVLAFKGWVVNTCPCLVESEEGMRQFDDALQQVIMALDRRILRKGENGGPSPYRRMQDLFLADIRDLKTGKGFPDV